MVQIKQLLFLFSLLGLCLACSVMKPNIESAEIKLEFLDEYIYPENVTFGGTKIGGLSGVDFADGIYYLIADDPSEPRFYQATIDISNASIDTVIFTKTVFIKDDFNFLDMEAIRFNPGDNSLIISTEGHINSGKDPIVFSIDTMGKVKYTYAIPDYFLANSSAKPRHNGLFEGLCKSYGQNGFWVGMELPLENDGSEPATVKGYYPVRITLFDNKAGKAIRQFAYPLDNIELVPKGDFAVNGLTDILEYNTDKFLVLERSFSSGWGTHGNVVKVFKVDASKATNTLNTDCITQEEIIPASKELLFNFNTIKGQLTDGIIDNIEGFTFGPTLPDGSKTLLFVADNNFNKLGKQLNQFILLRLVEKL